MMLFVVNLCNKMTTVDCGSVKSINRLVSFLLHYHVNKSGYKPCHVNKLTNRLEHRAEPSKQRTSRVNFLFYNVNKLWHHVNKAWDPACNVVDIGSRSCTASSVITAMQRKRLKKIVLKDWQLNAVKSDLRQTNCNVKWNFCCHLRSAQTAISLVFVMRVFVIGMLSRRYRLP